tara:strand:- start:2487 stop:2678 length:192 start_codon:yes stop_codon:yes gene_type:complete
MIEEILDTIIEQLPESLAMSFLDSYGKAYAHNPDELGKYSWAATDSVEAISKLLKENPDLRPI